MSLLEFWAYREEYIMRDTALLRLAEAAMAKSYSPYSNFRVGAALETKNGTVYTGTNIENISFGATICAERTAVFKAVSEGETEFVKIAIVSDSVDYVFPCGICRQVLAEFNDGSMKVICSNNKGDYKSFLLDELIPFTFDI